MTTDVDQLLKIMDPEEEPTTASPGSWPDPIPGELYLHLFHGRTDPDQEMEDWGTDGPSLGPLDSVRWTYGNIRVLFKDPKQAVLFGLPEFDDIDLPIGGQDMILLDGVYYGDWEVNIVPEVKP